MKAIIKRAVLKRAVLHAEGEEGAGAIAEVASFPGREMRLYIAEGAIVDSRRVLLKEGDIAE